MNIKMPLAILAVLFSFAELSAQENFREPTPLSPNTSAFARYGEHPVNLNTGMVNISVPLHTLSTGNIDIPISLSYHASGIRVNELASFVGLGWSLNAGGSIVRNVRGIEDEAIIGEIKRAEDIVLNANNVDVEADYSYLVNILLGRADNLYDTYHLNANGLTAKFWIDDQGNFIIEDGSPLVITKDATSSYFEVTDQLGVVYRFGTDLDGTEFIEKTDDQYDSPGLGVGRHVKTCWKLTEIISPSKFDTVRFRYQKETYIKPVDVGSEAIAIQPSGGTLPSLKRSKVFLIDELTLKDISHRDQKVIFNSMLDRIDVTAARRLDNIEIRHEDALVRKIKLDNNKYYDRAGVYHSRVYNQLSPGVFLDGRDDVKSLKLDGVHFLDKTDLLIEKYSFEYDPTQLPIRNSLARDHWGYYNGQTTNTGLVHTQLVSAPLLRGNTPPDPFFVGNANREPDELLMQAGILKKIIYPTGGYTEFEYEGHTWKSEEKEVSTEQKRVSVTAIGYPDRQCAKGLSSNCDPNTQVYDEITFTPLSDKDYVFATISLAMMDIENWDDVNCSKRQITLKRTDNESETVVYFRNGSPAVESRNEQVDLILKSGYQYKLIAEECGYGTSSPLYASPRSTATVTWQEEFKTDYFKIKHGSGLRIKTLKAFDKDHKMVSGKRYEYGSNGLGRLITYPSSYVGSDIVTQNQGGIGTVKYVSSNSMVEFGTNGGSPVEYDFVVEKQIDEYGNTNGYRKLTYEPVVSYHLFQNLHYEDCGQMFEYEFTDQNGGQLVVPTMDGAIDEINNRTNDFSVSWGSLGGSSVDYALTLTHQSQTFDYDTWDQFIIKVNELAVGNFQMAQVGNGQLNCPVLNGYPVGGLPAYPKFVYDHWAAGKLKKEEVYKTAADGTYTLIRSTENQYQNYNEGVVIGLGVYSRREGQYGPGTVFNYETLIVRYDDYLTTGMRLLKKQISTSIEEGQTLVEEKNYFYDNPHYLLTRVDSKTSLDGEILSQRFYYADEAAQIASLPAGQLALSNEFKKDGTIPRVGQQLQQETYVNADLVKTVRTEFTDQGANKVLPRQILTSTGNNPMVIEASYDQYDAYGNPLQITTKAGITTAYIWGYNHTQLIAKVENMDYAIALAALGGATVLDNLQGKTGAALLNDLAAIQTDPASSQALVTLYAYQPGVGLLSITDPTGRVTSFEYDDYGRLIYRKDHEGHIIEKISYHTAN